MEALFTRAINDDNNYLRALSVYLLLHCILLELSRLSKNCIHNLGLSGLKGRTTFHDGSLKYSQSLVADFTYRYLSFGAPTLQHVELEKFKRITQ